MLEAGANAGIRSTAGRTPLMAAIARGHEAAFRALLKFSAADLLDEQDVDGNTVLHHAIFGHQLKAANHLLRLELDFDAANKVGDTPLHAACREGLPSLVQSLCALGCRVDVLNRAGEHPLHLAARHGFIEIVRCLCLAGGNTDTVDHRGVTPQVDAIKHGHNEIGQLLSKVKQVKKNTSYERWTT